MNTLNTFAQESKRMFGEAEQSLSAGAESVQRHVAVTGINEHDLGYFRVSQMKAPTNVISCDTFLGKSMLMTAICAGKVAAVCRMASISAAQHITSNSGRCRRAPTRSWHSIWLESATRTRMALNEGNDIDSIKASRKPSRKVLL